MPTDIDILREAFEKIGVKTSVSVTVAYRYLFIQVPPNLSFKFNKNGSWAGKRVG